MRVRSALLSTVLALSAMGTSHVFAASSSSTIKPQGDWAVTKVESKQAGAAPYCALARRYGNGSIVTFARNSANETSVAVDFPPGSFKTAQNYTVVLDPGAGENRSYKTQPVSERGMVIRMGRDDSFYSALEKTGNLSITVEDKSYSFAMNDIKSGTSDLSACLGNAVQPAAGKAADNAPRNMSKTEKMVEAVMPDRAPPPPGSSAIPTSDGEVQGLKEENIRLRNALERERREYEDKMQKSDSSSAAAELNEKLQILTAENAQLKSKVGSVKSLSADAGAVVPAVNDSRLADLQAENAKLKSDVESTRQKMASMEQDSKTAAALQAENAKLKSDLDSSKQKTVAAVTDEKMTSSLRAENAQLKSDLDATKQKVAMQDAGEKAAAALKAENAQLKSDLDATKQKMAAQGVNEKMAAALMAENTQLKSDLEATKQKVSSVDDAGKTVAALKAENTELKSTLDTMKQKMAGMEVENKASLALRAENDQLKSDLAAVQLKVATVTPADKAVVALQAENTKLKSDLDETKQKMAAQNTENQSVIALRAENAQLKADLDASKKLAMAAPTPLVDKASDQAVVALKTENAQLKTQLDSTKQQVSALETAQKTFVDKKPMAAINTPDPLVKVLKDQVSKLESENSELKLAVANTKPAAGTASSSSMTPMPSSAMVDDAQANTGSLARLHAVEVELASAKAERDRLATEVQIAKNASSGAAANSPISSANWNLEQATQRYNEAEREISRMASVVESERAKCTVEKKNIEYMLFDPKIATKEQQAKLMSLENDLAEARKGIDTSKDKTIADLKQQVSMLQSRTANQVMAQAAMPVPSAPMDVPSASMASPTPAMAPVAARTLASSTITPMPVPEKISRADSEPAVERVAFNDISDRDAIAHSMANIRPASGGDAAISRNSARPMPAPMVKPSVEISREDLDVPPAPAMPVAAVTSAPVASIAAAVQPAKAKLMSLPEVNSLLAQSGVKVSGKVSPVAASTDAGRVAYRWETEGVFGTIEQKSMDNPGQFNTFVQAYLDKTKSRCKGEFAAMPGDSNAKGGMNTSTYEIACVDEKSGTGASAALVFVSQGQNFTTIAHESSSDAMDIAMDVRDKIVAALDNGIQTASR